MEDKVRTSHRTKHMYAYRISKRKEKAKLYAYV
ncbi:hypothetical protein CCACVL1_18058 [Corchorus capsularis]|uniref:Uncharacterized protein n=1 Tax=Corchorus capsularis TaxID=210143 RepID=A0A1R3HN49_COCAP|nr:hypothetical protein CCACVL1_18058 [Corchorus capsularis]